MKVSFNSKFITGPYGGGMKLVIFLKNYLEGKGIDVVNNLKDDDIDIILNFGPFSETSNYSFFDAYLYKIKHPETVIILRINNSDEGRGTNGLNKLFVKTSQYSDFVIYISQYLEKIFNKKIQNNSLIIHNGGDISIFNSQNKKYWNKKSPLQIVTHHWSDNINKGHDIYLKMDTILSDKRYKNKFTFSYIGNVPVKIKNKYKNVNFINTMSEKQLGCELKKYDLYLTAAQNEGAGMHHIEGALCGLPLLYRNSGALPEYCHNFGICFNFENFEEKLNEMYNNFDFWLMQIKKYNKTADQSAYQYYELMLELYNNKKKYTLRQNKWIKYFYHIIKVYSAIYMYSLRYYKKIKFKISKII